MNYLKRRKIRKRNDKKIGKKKKMKVRKILFRIRY